MQRSCEVAFLFMLALGLTACSTDHRAEIALKTLYSNDGTQPTRTGFRETLPVLVAALNAKFPAGSDVNAIKPYVASLGGTCQQESPGKAMSCSFVETASFCMRHTVSIEATVDSADKIRTLAASRDAVAC